jgi:hypothetical protein
MVGCHSRHLESEGCSCPQIQGWVFIVGFPQLWMGDAARSDSAHQGLWCAPWGSAATMAHRRSAEPVTLRSHKVEEAANVSKNAGTSHLAADISHILLVPLLFLGKRMRGAGGTYGTPRFRVSASARAPR